MLGDYTKNRMIAIDFWDIHQQYLHAPTYGHSFQDMCRSFSPWRPC
jgi:hypothetical protein